MRKYPTREGLFGGMSRLVDIAALAHILVNSPYIEFIKDDLFLTDEDIVLIKRELDTFFREESDG